MEGSSLLWVVPSQGWYKKTGRASHRNKPASCTPPWPLHQLLTPQVPALTAVEDELWNGSVNKIHLFPPSCVCSWSFITVVATPVKTPCAGGAREGSFGSRYHIDMTVFLFVDGLMIFYEKLWDCSHTLCSLFPMAFKFLDPLSVMFAMVLLRKSQEDLQIQVSGWRDGGTGGTSRIIRISARWKVLGCGLQQCVFVTLLNSTLENKLAHLDTINRRREGGEVTHQIQRLLDGPHHLSWALGHA